MLATPWCNEIQARNMENLNIDKAGPGPGPSWLQQTELKIVILELCKLQ